MAAVAINGYPTTCIRVDIVCDADGARGATSGEEVASILREVADKFEAGKRPMQWNEDSVGGASVDWY